MTAMRSFAVAATAMMIALLCSWLSMISALNIALHAQVAPDEKVVGSVITTDGLKAAFDKIPLVDHVEVFYPYSYQGFYERHWDFILIEGWFPSIDIFLLLARNHAILNGRGASQLTTKIVFICLDHSYPGLNVVKGLDVDGYLTNSVQVLPVLSLAAPTRFMLLAADPEKMKPPSSIYEPASSVSRPYGAVYVGAGGLMLKYKPQLMSFLLDALPFGLRLHGSGWDMLPPTPNGNDLNANPKADRQDIENRLMLKEVWQGSLPQHELANAYASASAVIAITVETQAASHMINNRIFEALSCGCIVISSKEDAIISTFGDVILYADYNNNGGTDNYKSQQERRLVRVDTFDGESHTVSVGSVASHLDWIREYPEQAHELRQRARRAVLEKHTWSHRVVDVLSFYYGLSDVYTLPSSAALSVDLDVNGDHSEAVPQIDESEFSQPLSKSASLLVPRQQRSKLLWVVSKHLLTHPDYLYGVHQMRILLADGGAFEVVVVSEEQLTAFISAGTNIESPLYAKLKFLNWWARFKVVVGVFTPFDVLDLSLRDAYRFVSVSGGITSPASRKDYRYSLATGTTDLFGMLHDPLNRATRLHIQRRCAFILGFDSSRVDMYANSLLKIAAVRTASARSKSSSGFFSVKDLSQSLQTEFLAVRQERLPLSTFHDMVWTRSFFELELVSRHVESVLAHPCDAVNTKLLELYYEALSEYEPLTGSHPGSEWMSSLYSASAPEYNPVIHPLRTQHGFGLVSDVIPFLSGNIETDKAHYCAQSGRQRRTIAICLYDHSHLCNDIPVVTSTLGSNTGALLQQVVWLLIGGESINDWLQRVPALNQLLIDADSGRLLLEHVVVIPSTDAAGGHAESITRVVLERYLVCASKMVYFHQPNADLASVVAAPGGDSETARVLSTENDVLWPLVAATVHQVPLHLSHSNPHLLHTAESGSDVWDHHHHLHAIHEGLMRLVGFPSSRHARGVHIIHPANNTFVDTGGACSENDVPAESGLHTGLVVLALSYGIEGGTDAFIAGLDGQLCIDLHGEILGCLLRSFRFLVLDMGLNRGNTGTDGHACACGDASMEMSEESLAFRLKVRGNILGDIIHSSDDFLLRRVSCRSQRQDVLEEKKEDRKYPVRSFSNQKLMSVVKEAMGSGRSDDHPWFDPGSLDSNDIFYMKIPI